MIKLGLLGETLVHSLSPDIHARLGKEAKIELNYDLVEVKKENIKVKLKELSQKYRGVNVTIPHKIAVISELDELSKEAKEIGAVNTIFFKDGKKIGYNTDYFGFARMLLHNGIDVRGKKAVVMGAGGASRAVIKYLLDQDVEELLVVARNKVKAAYDLKDFAIDKVKFLCFKDLEELNSKGYLIVNTTPVGMYPYIGYSPVCEDIIKKYKVAVDLVYNPETTEFLEIATENNLKTVNGLFMLVAQAAKSEEIWFESQIDGEVIDKIAKDLTKVLDNTRNNRNNIIIIGMPGAGKSVFGKRIAMRLGMKFCDSDEYLEVSRNTTIKYLFKKSEEHFRNIETQCSKELSELKNTVISTGGGVVTRSENMEYLKKSGIVLFINREPDDIVEDIKTEKRPLLKDKRKCIFDLYDKRIELYKEYADVIVENNGSVKGVTKRIIEAVKDKI